MSSIWFAPPDLERLAADSGNTAAGHLGIEFLDAGDRWLRARMPVDARTRQPYGVLHGGASALLAETVGSVAASCCIDPATHRVLGLEINANHIRSATDGWVIATAEPLHVGRSTQVWSIRIEDEAGRLVCISRLTMTVVPAERLSKR